MLITLSTFTSLTNVQMSVKNLIQNTDTNLSGSKFPSNHLKLERSPGVVIFTHACGTVTVAQLSSGRCRYDPHFPSMYMFITRSLFSCWRYSGKFRSNMGADVSTIKKHLHRYIKSFTVLMRLLSLYTKLTSLYPYSNLSVTWTKWGENYTFWVSIILEKKWRIQYNTHLFDSSQKTYIILIL